MSITAHRVLLGLAVIVFALAAFGVAFPLVAIVPLGLALLAAGLIP